MKKNVLFLAFFVVFFTPVSSFALNVSPCQNPNAQSYTVCEYNNCTTYCNSSYQTIIPAFSFGFSTPSGHIRISNNYIGMNIRPKHHPAHIPPMRPMPPAVHHAGVHPIKHKR